MLLPEIVVSFCVKSAEAHCVITHHAEHARFAETSTAQLQTVAARIWYRRNKKICMRREKVTGHFCVELADQKLVLFAGSNRVERSPLTR